MPNNQEKPAVKPNTDKSGFQYRGDDQKKEGQKGQGDQFRNAEKQKQQQPLDE